MVVLGSTLHMPSVPLPSLSPGWACEGGLLLLLLFFGSGAASSSLPPCLPSSGGLLSVALACRGPSLGGCGCCLAGPGASSSWLLSWLRGRRDARPARPGPPPPPPPPSSSSSASSLTGLAVPPAAGAGSEDGAGPAMSLRAAPTEDGGASAPAGPPELSLEEVLKAYEQPLNEEQAWAVAFQVCRGIQGAGKDGPARGPQGRLAGPADLLLRRDGAVAAKGESGLAELPLTLTPSAEAQMVQSLGFAIYRALDWGLDENEERELSPDLERLIDLMVNSDSEDSSCGTADEGYGGQDEEDEEEEEAAAAASRGALRAVRTFRQVMRLCASRLSQPQEAQAHYQAVCRALFLETVELKAFLAKIQETKEMLTKLKNEDEELRDRSVADLDNLRNTDWARLWVQLMRELRNGVKLKKVQEKQFDPLPTEYQLTPFEMLMQDIRARNYKLRKVMVDGDIPPRVKKDAHALILDFIRSRPPLRQASERRLRPIPQRQRTLHEKILEEIKQERKLRPVEERFQNQKGFGSVPCLVKACSGDAKSTSCINLSASDSGTPVQQRQRPRILLKAPTLAEMEEMLTSEEEDSPGSEALQGLGLKRDRSFSEQDLAQFQSESQSNAPDAENDGYSGSEPRPRSGSVPASYHPVVPCGSSPFPAKQGFLSSVDEKSEAGSGPPPLESSMKYLWLQEFSHPVESLALTVEEMVNVRRVLVKAEMEKFQQSKELYSSMKKGKICCCCKTKFALFSWPPTCLFCKRSVCGSCSLKIKMPSKKLAHIPVYALGFETLPGSLGPKAPPFRKKETFHPLQGTRWRSVEEEFPYIYAHGSVLKDVCSDCSGFVTDVVSSSRKSVDILNTATPDRRSRKTQSLYISSS